MNRTLLARDLRSMIEGLSVEIQIGGKLFRGAIVQSDHETIITNYGDVSTYTTSVIVARDDLGSIPEKDTTVTLQAGLSTSTLYVVGAREYDFVSVVLDLRK